MYNVLIIGAGKIGALFDFPASRSVLTYAHAFTISPFFLLKGFYDIEINRARQAAVIWKCSAYDNIDKAMEDIDIVCCCVPDVYHYELLKKISTYRVNIIIMEKPLVNNFREINNIKSLIKREDHIIVNYSRRFLTEFQQLKKSIKEYGIFIKGTGYYGKGIVHNGSHMIDLLGYLIGKIQTYDKASEFIYDENDDPSLDVVLFFENGYFRMNCIDCSIATIFELDLFFEKARVRILNGGTEIEIHKIKESDLYKGYFNYRLEETIHVEYGDAMTNLVHNALLCLTKKEKPICGLRESIEVLETCFAIRGDAR